MANETIIINDDLRTMQIPSSIVLLGVESDDDVNRIPFQMPKEYCGFDLSTFQARINYINANGTGDIYIVDDLAVDGDDPSLMNFTWLVGRTACAYKGNTKFIVCLKKFDENQNVVQEFNTTVYSLPVLEGLETTEAVVQQNPDIIEKILTMIEDAGSIDMTNYYTKEQVNALKLANPHSLMINGIEYDGSEAVELEIEGGSSQTTEIASGTILHVTDAVAAEPVKSLLLYDESGDEISSANVAIANKNLFRIDQLAQQTVSKGITFEKNADGAIHATGTSTGTYAATQATIDTGAFVVGETYTISSGKTSGILYVQLILNYTDGTTDYLVSSNQPYTFTLAKEVSSVIGSVQITASGVTVDEWIYPMIEVSDVASAFTNNFYTSMTYDGSLMPVLPDSISNLWSNNSSVNNIVMEYWNDPVMAKVNELEKQFYQTVEHDSELNANSERAVQNKTVTAELFKKIDKPSTGVNGQILTKTNEGVQWSDAGTPTDTQVSEAVSDWLDDHPDATTTVADGSITVEKLDSDVLEMLNAGGGLSENAKLLLISILKNAVYTSDQTENIDALEIALDESGGDSGLTRYSVTYSLTDVISSNTITGAYEGRSYETTLSGASSLYVIDSVTVTMNNVDVTSSVYNSQTGKISIDSVTGAIAITASAVYEIKLITEGLHAYFDLRSAEYNNSGSGGSTRIYSTQGTPTSTYQWAGNAITGQDEDYGMTFGNSRSNQLASAYDGTSALSSNSEYTVIGLSFNTLPIINNGIASNNVNGIEFGAPYTNTSNAIATTGRTPVNCGIKESNGKWNALVIRVTEEKYEVFVNSEVVYTKLASELDDFQSWVINPYFKTGSGATNKFMTCYGLYDRALTDVEVINTFAFLESLEVE